MRQTPDPEAVAALELLELCQGLGCLPRAGGLLDQDGYHVHLLKAAFIVKREKEQKVNADHQAEMKRMQSATRSARTAHRRR